ncbi:transglycosylase SLT domain-containing protein [Acinetobacter radioresistens]|uniref:transglycosylase SLT domain-containing protein n=1 Tax=Acinetobacter radioresistens TaxID=40216 RepID=UPI002247525F|nr:transglycosylase SLT domain-containing protein [Acinetobacter radioresistens]MCX0334789.1 transglycosylase SLT domain-containing protein [Acinetobacter radioresistens]
MSNWLSEYSGEDQRQIDELNAKGLQYKDTTPKEVPGAFSGAILAPLRGAGAGFAKAADTITKPIAAIADRLEYTVKDLSNDDFIEPYQEFKDKKEDARNSLILEGVKALEDKENTGIVGNIGFALGDYATRAVAGSLAGGTAGAALVTGLSETDYNYKDLVDQGVDSDTAFKTAAVDGAVAGISTALPLSLGFKGKGGLVKDAVISVGGATAVSTGGQALSGEILESEGYEKQAKKYEVTSESIGTEVLLNGLLFGAGRYMQGRLNTDIETELSSLDVDQIEARNTQIEAVLEVNRMQLDDTSTSVKPSNPIQHNNHLKNLNDATESIRAGWPVNVVHPVHGDEKQRSINYETMSLPGQGKNIAKRAQQEGIDPSVALTISHLETSGRFNPSAKNPTSTAHGVFQVLSKTWKQLGGGNRNDVNEQIRIGLKHIKMVDNYISKNLGRPPVAHEQYLGHLLGPGGAVKVLKADPNRPLIDVVREYNPKDANAIVNNNGMKGLTVGQAISKWRNKWNALSARYGGSGTSTAYGMDGSSYDVAYEVRDLNELITSNDALYGVNPAYPSELQPRDRTRAASRQQIENMANDLKPELVGESYKLSDGAPIIGMDNVVESGNGRTLAIGKAYESGRADAYRDFVQNWANERGMDISGINSPVLVRTRLTDTDRVEFARLANESDVAQFSASERAVSDVDRLPDASLLKINNDGTINLDGSMDFVRNFVNQLPQSERASVMTSEGRLSQEGKRRIESAMVQRTYGDSSLVTRLAENLDDDSKSVLNALLRAAPQLAQLSDLVKQGGRHQNTIAQDLAQAAQKLSDLKASGQNVPDYLNQGQLIDDGLAPGAREFLNVFDQNKRSAKAIGENIQARIEEIEAMGDPRQGSLFGDGPEEKAALDIIFNNPDQEISVSRMRPDGEIEEITMTLRERLDELEAEARQAQQDTLAAQTAISCALQFGE